MKPIEEQFEVAPLKQVVFKMHTSQKGKKSSEKKEPSRNVSEKPNIMIDIKRESRERNEVKESKVYLTLDRMLELTPAD